MEGPHRRRRRNKPMENRGALRNRTTESQSNEGKMTSRRFSLIALTTTAATVSGSSTGKREEIRGYQ